MEHLVKGAVVDDRFEVEYPAGVGGMGRVYRALDRQTGQPVALKVLASDTADNASRFRREARVLSELRHPGIVRYVAHGLVEGRAPYLVMEWVGGVSLADKLAQRELGVAPALLLMRKLAEALAVAHERGIVHRDLKPTNIHLLGGDLSQPKLLDFGLARSDEASQEITKSGVMLGTPAYMAPEQARNAADITPSADVFALGCILFECLTGRRAFAGPNVVSVLCKVLLEEPPPVHDLAPAVPEALSVLVTRMLAKEPDERPADALHLRAALELDRETRPLSRTRRGIGDAEARFHSVILAGWPSDGDLPETLSMSTGEFTRSAIELALGRWAPALEWMIDGSLVLTLTGEQAATDGAARAARCALAVRDLLPASPLVLATGRAVLSGSKPVGEVIDTASALLERAIELAKTRKDAGPILLDDVTAGLLDDGFELNTGEGGHELMGYRGEAAGVRRLLGKRGICVGRSRQLSTMHATLEECVEDSASRAMVVTGPAGIGKSRLLGEFLHGDESELLEQTRVLVARVDPLSAGGAFGVVASLVREAAGVSESDRPERAQMRLLALVGELFEQRDDALRVTHFLAEMVGAPFAPSTSVQLTAAAHDPVLRGDQIRRAFADLVERLTRRSPLLLVVEDLQWGDRPSVEMLDAALRRLEESPLTVLALARPEVFEAFPKLFAGRDRVTLSLGPLRRRAGLRLVQAAMPELPEARALQLVNRSGGNPFFLEELVRAEAAGRGQESVPGTVLAMAQGRLSAQPELARRLLRAGSVFGESFWIGAAAHVLDALDLTAELGEAASHLVDAEILVRAEGSRVAGHDELAFAHGLWREAAYASLTEADRSLAHRLAAGWLRDHGQLAPLALAEHYRLGGELGQAADLYRRAAEQALAADDLPAALTCARTGLRAGIDGEAEGELLRVEAETQKWLGDNAEAERAARLAVERCAPGGASFFVAAGEAQAAAGKRGHLDAVRELSQRVLDTPPREGAGAARVAALARGATQLVLGGALSEAAPLFVELDACAEAEPASLGWVYEARALRATAQDDAAGRVALAERAARAFETAGDLRNACLQLTSRGFGLNELGAYAEAELALRQAVDIARFMGLTNALATAGAQLGRALVRQGKEEGEAVLEDAIEAFERQGNPRLEGVARATLARWLMERGRLGPAEEQARRAIDAVQKAPPLRVVAEATLALVLLAREQSKEALAHAEVAAEWLAKLGNVPTGEGLARLVHVRALRASGEEAKADEALALARARLEERAAAIVEDDLRRAFLEDVAEHDLGPTIEAVG